MYGHSSSLDDRILIELSRFMYLTNSQLRTLGVSVSERSLNRKLLILEEFKFLRAIRFKTVPARESFYTLTKKGARLVSDRTGKDLSEIPYTKNAYAFHSDASHRKLTIDFHIALEKWIRKQEAILDGAGEGACEGAHKGISLPLFDRYFEATGTNRTDDPLRPRLSSKTRVQFGRHKRLYPDVNFLLSRVENGQESSRLFSLEVCRGVNFARIEHQIIRHMEVMSTGLLPSKYGFDGQYQVLFLFEEEVLARRVMIWFREVVPPVWHPFFLFGLVGDVLLDSVGSWFEGGGKQRNLLLT